MVHGEAGGVAGGELEDEFGAGAFDGSKGELADVIELVLNIDVEVFGDEDSFGFIEDSRELSGVEAVVEIVMDPGLKAAEGFFAESAAAVDEVFINASGFGDVGVGRDECAVGKLEAEVGFGMRGEELFELVDFHDDFKKLCGCCEGALSGRAWGWEFRFFARLW